jgi:cytochrome c
MKMGVVSASLAAMLVMAQFRVLAQNQSSTRDGVYTDVQAERGRESYEKACASCHAETLEGSGAATPPLRGEEFTMNWAGQTVDDLFERIQTSMPADRPGKLSRGENADILAYILKINKLPPGGNDLPTDAESLKEIEFEAAK